MKKLVNLRVPVLCAIFLVLGIFLATVFYFTGVSQYFLLAAVPICGLSYAIYRIFKNRNLQLIINIVLILMLFLFGGFSSFGVLGRFEKVDIPQGYCEVSGKVVEKEKTKNGNEYIVIDGIKIKGERHYGKAIIYLSNEYGEFCDIGYEVNFTARLYQYDALYEGELTYDAIEGIKYSASVYGGMQSEYRFSLFGSVRKAINRVFYENLDTDSAAVCVGLLTGNTQHIDNDVISAFRYGGIAHIFAVSGLHIGIVFCVASFILKKLHANKYLAAAICLLLIVFYAGVCGFTLSSVRAVIMCAVSIAAKLLNEKYDSFNALGVAVVLILAISPLSLFSVGFQLSVCAVGTIILLSGTIQRLLTKIKTPRSVASLVGVSVSAQLGTMPVMLANFGYLSSLGLILNIIMVPLISIIFTVLFIAVFLSLIIPVAAPFLVTNAALPLEAVLSWLVGAGLEKSIITGFGTGAFGIIYFALLVFLSDKINLNRHQRLIYVSYNAILLVTYSIVMAS